MFQPVMIVIYLVIINLVILIRLYRSYLRYLSPIKGYVATLFILTSLVTVDYAIFNATQEENLSAGQRLEIKTYGSVVNLKK